MSADATLEVRPSRLKNVGGLGVFVLLTVGFGVFGDHKTWPIYVSMAVLITLTAAPSLFDTAPRLILSPEGLCWRRRRKDALSFLAWDEIVSADTKAGGEDEPRTLVLRVARPDWKFGERSDYRVDIPIEGMDLSERQGAPPLHPCFAPRDRLAGLTPGPRALWMPPVYREPPAMSEMITLTAAHDGFGFTALHAQPESARKGGVIVIQEIFGLDQYVRADVARWAERGFEVLAPSMFDRQEKGFSAEHDPDGFANGVKHAKANGPDNAMGDIQACIDFLKDRGPVFIVGYCYGGTMAWLAASRLEGLSAASSYYGGQVAGMAKFALKAPVIVHLGAKDPHIPAEEVKAAIWSAHPEVPIHIYEASGHGFNNDGRPDSDLADAKLARERTLAFFQAHGAL